MTIPAEQAGKHVDGDVSSQTSVNMANGTTTGIMLWFLWVVAAVMNVALLVLIAVGDA